MINLAEIIKLIAIIVIFIFTPIIFPDELGKWSLLLNGVGMTLIGVVAANGYLKKPVLSISDEVEIRSFCPPCMHGFEYMANRIIIENKGNISATNCKAFIEIDGSSEMLCWTVPSDRPVAVINPGDKIRLDFCAMQNTSDNVAQHNRILFPTEDGWHNCRRMIMIPNNSQGMEGSKKDLFRVGYLDFSMPVKILITAENAKSIKKEVRFNTNEATISLH